MATTRKPPNAGKGRPAGVPNKVTGDVKAMILAALDKAGGEDYLLQQATENPQAFMTLVGKVMPTQVNSNVDGKIEVSWSRGNGGDSSYTLRAATTTTDDA